MVDFIEGRKERFAMSKETSTYFELVYQDEYKLQPPIRLKATDERAARQEARKETDSIMSRAGRGARYLHGFRFRSVVETEI